MARKKNITRRTFIQTTSAAAAGSAILVACGDDDDDKGPITPTQPKTLKIRQQGHFVPNYDAWFDQFAKDWGDDNNVTVTVEHVSRGALLEKPLGDGDDLIEHLTPTAQHEENVHDLKDLNDKAAAEFGAQIAFQKKTVLNSKTGKYYAFAPGWAPNNGNYRKSLWTDAGLENGPTTYDELKAIGTDIWAAKQIPIAIGMSDELDAGSNLPGVILAFGGAIQDANHQVVINSAETIAAVEFMKGMYEAAQGVGGAEYESFGDKWGSGTNNALFNSGKASYIVNPISHYRGALRADSQDLKDIAADNFISKALAGPGNANNPIIPANISFAYIAPKTSDNVETAKEFLLHLTANYDEAIQNAELYNFPSYPSTAPTQQASLANDPFGSVPTNKLLPFQDAATWNTNVGHPGTDNPAVGEAFFTFVIPRMFAAAVDGGKTAAQAVKDAEDQLNVIYTFWRDKGLL